MSKSKALDKLKALALEDLKGKYPTFPEDYLPQKKYSDKTANGLTNCIVDYIRFTGGYADRINNMGTYTPEKISDDGAMRVIIQKGGWRPGGNRKGIADIMAAKKGRMVAIEVKIGKDRMSKHQLKIKDEIESTGAAYIIARDFEQFYDEWDSI